MLLALVHAELGGMYPVAGGTARFPHYAFGGAAGASFGWFSWLQAATVAPIEVMRSSSTRSTTRSRPAGRTQGGQDVLTEERHRRRDRADGGLHRRQLPRHPAARAHQQRHDLVEDRRPAAGDPRARARTSTPATSRAANGFSPYGAKGILAAVSTGGIIFALLGFEQADQLAGESANPKRDIPRAVIGSISIGIVIYVLLQIVFLAALPSRADRQHVGNGRLHEVQRPVRPARDDRRRSAGSRRSSTSTPSSPRAGPA